LEEKLVTVLKYGIETFCVSISIISRVAGHSVSVCLRGTIFTLLNVFMHAAVTCSATYLLIRVALCAVSVLWDTSCGAQRAFNGSMSIIILNMFD